MKTTLRCDSVMVAVTITEYDQNGRPCGEMVSQPLKMFRSKSPDFWAEIDKSVKALDAQRDAQPTAPTLKKGK